MVRETVPPRSDAVQVAALLDSPEIAGIIANMIAFGDPDSVGENLANALMNGVDGFTMSLPANGHIPERVELLGEVAAKVVG